MLVVHSHASSSLTMFDVIASKLFALKDVKIGYALPGCIIQLSTKRCSPSLGVMACICLIPCEARTNTPPFPPT